MTEEVKLSKYTTTEYNRSRRVLSAIKNVYDSARAFHKPHDWILSELAEKVYPTTDYQRLKPYYQGYIAGYTEKLRDEFYRVYLVWRVCINGVLVDSDTVKDWSGVDPNGGRHVYADKPDCVF